MSDSTETLPPLALRVPDACRESGVSRTVLYSALRRGDLRARKLGKATLILRSDLEAWLSNLPAHEPAAPKLTAAQIEDIRQLCVIADRDHLAAEFIAAGMEPAAVRGRLLAIVKAAANAQATASEAA